MLVVEGSTVQRPWPSPPEAAAVLLCAATRWEAAPIAARLNLRSADGVLWKGLVSNRPVLLLKTGIGPERAALALSGVHQRLGQADARLSCVLSVGLAGALQEGMRTGDIVADLQGAEIELVEAARDLAAARGTPIHFGPIAHSDKVLATPAEKALFARDRRAAAVDMESLPLRQWAQRRDVPFYAVRVVLDGLDDSLPRSVPAGEDFRSLARYAFDNRTELPVLLSTAMKQKKAMANLSSFLGAFLAKL